jgi:lysophospholipase L1-like esterase
VGTATPQQLRLAAALDSNETLGSLLQRLRASQARLSAILPLLPPTLKPHVRAGALDDSAWLLLADHAAAAAKLRQLAPALQAALADAGWPEPPLRIKVSPPR